MQKNRKPVLAVCGILALVLFFSIGATGILASDAQADGQRSNLGKAGSFSFFNKLVTDGVITQDQADQIAACLNAKAEERKAYLEANRLQKSQETPDLLDNLVTDGVITQDQADQIAAYLNAKAEERKAERESEIEKMKDMTAEERKAYLEANRPRKSQETPDLLDNLVAAGIITAEKADEISKLLPEKIDRPTRDLRRGPLMKGNISKE